jgi:hypothetical protein
MFRTKNRPKSSLIKRFPEWIENENDMICTVKRETPIYWILTKKQGINSIKSHGECCFNKQHINFNTIERDLAEYYHMREEQFKCDNNRIREENKKLVNKLAEEDIKLEKLENRLKNVYEELDLTKREKWKQLFESVLREIVTGKRYQKDVDQLRSAYEKELNIKRGFLARMLNY